MKILSAGIIVADILVKGYERLPEPNELVHSEPLKLEIGGGATNVGIALDSIGAEVEIIGYVGDDIFGDGVFRLINETSVHTTFLKKSRNFSTSTSIVLIPESGERAFIHHAGANGCLTSEDLIEAIDNLNGDLFNLSGYGVLPGIKIEDLKPVFLRAKEKDMKISFDVVTVKELEEYREKFIKEILPLVDIFTPNFEEAKIITGFNDPKHSAMELGKICRSIAAVTMGEDGAYISNGNDVVYLPPLEIENVDTTGAGDAFLAGLIYGFLKNWDIEKIGKFAAIMGALATTEMGASAVFRQKKRVQQFLRNYI